MSKKTLNEQITQPQSIPQQQYSKQPQTMPQQPQYGQQSQYVNHQFNASNSTEEELSLFGYFKKCIKNYANFKGRARRKEYWGYSLFLAIFYFVIVIFSNIFIKSGSIGAMIFGGLLLILFAVAILLPTLAVTVRRLHDIGKSGGWIFISMVPFIGSIWLLILMLREGESVRNIYGEPTKNFGYYR